MVKIVFEPGDVFECDGGRGMVIGDDRAITFYPHYLGATIKADMEIRMEKIPEDAFPAKLLTNKDILLCIKTAGVALGVPVDLERLNKPVMR